MNNKLNELSKILVNYSINVNKNERVLIIGYDIKTKPLIKELIKEIFNAGGIPFVRIEDNEIDAMLISKTNDERINNIKKQKEDDNDNYDAFIQIRYTNNEFEENNIDPKIKKQIGKELIEVNDIRINQRKWVLLNYPSMVDAIKAKMPYDDFYNFAIESMTYDYKKMLKDIEPLKNLMESSKKVRIKGPNTDITFSIEGMPAIPCCGECNIPDGEIFTAPIKDSVNGVITYNTPSPYNGYMFNDISLKFENGKIVKATCKDGQDKLNEIFDTDEGSRYIGEFSFGLNPLIKNPIGDILYDEKIKGSIHFTPGRCYEDCNNNNISAIHWDLVLIQTPEYGGGEIYLDDILIRKDGKFILDNLKQLN